MPDPPSLLEDEAAAAAFLSGDLWAGLDGVSVLNDATLPAEQLARLHRTGSIDLLNIDVAPILGLPPHRRYVAVRLLRAAVEKLDVEPLAVLAFVVRLTAALGEHSHDIAEGLRLWCAAHPNQASTLIDLAESGDEDARRLLGFVLIGAGDVSRMRELARSSDLALVEPALRALSRTEHSDEQASFTIRLLLDLAGAGPSDAVRAGLIMVLFEGVAIRRAEAIEARLDVLTTLLNDGGRETLHALAYGLFTLASPPGPGATDLCLPRLSELGSDEKRTLDLVDHLLGTLVAAGGADVAADLVFTYAARAPDPVALERFEGFAAALFAAPPEVVGRIVPEWLRRGDNAVSADLSHLFQRQDRANKPLAAIVDPEWPSEVVYFVCRQAIGWFLLEEVVAASIVVAALRTADENLGSALIDLLVDPLLLNYDGALRSYLDGLGEDDPAAAAVAIGRERADAYRAGIEGEWVRELTPSQSRLQLAHNQRADAMHRTQREGRKASIFANLVTSQHLLYTDRATTYWVNPDGTFEATENQLQAFSYSYELPRQDVLDPVGLAMRHRELCYGRRRGE